MCSQPVGVGLDDLVADGRVGTALQEQADHLEVGKSLPADWQRPRALYSH